MGHHFKLSSVSTWIYSLIDFPVYLILQKLVILCLVVTLHWAEEDTQHDTGKWHEWSGSVVMLHSAKAESKGHSDVRGASNRMSCLFNWKDFRWKAHWFSSSLCELSHSQCESEFCKYLHALSDSSEKWRTPWDWLVMIPWPFNS